MIKNERTFPNYILLLLLWFFITFFSPSYQQEGYAREWPHLIPSVVIFLCNVLLFPAFRWYNHRDVKKQTEPQSLQSDRISPFLCRECGLFPIYKQKTPWYNSVWDIMTRLNNLVWRWLHTSADVAIFFISIFTCDWQGAIIHLEWLRVRGSVSWKWPYSLGWVGHFFIYTVPLSCYYSRWDIMPRLNLLEDGYIPERMWPFSFPCLRNSSEMI